MLLQVALLFLALFTGKFDVITKPILSLQPPWTTVFSKEKVKLTCEQLNLTGLSDIIWYRNGEKFYQSSRNSIVIWKSGQYSCGSQGYAPSDPVAITFSNDWLILQVPYSVFEGDAVILQCQGWKKAKLSQVTFHKERKFIHFTKENNSLPIKSARIEHSGLYSCSGYVNHQKNNQSSTPAILQVQELFPPPELRIKNSTETMEGNLMALSCETQLPLQRSSSQLYFSFFKDNKTIRDRDQSPEYCIPGTIIGDAGLYWCEAATEDGQVKKQSLGLEIQVPRGSRNSQLVLQITLTLLGVTGISTVLLFCFRFMKKSEGTAASDPARGPFFLRIPEAPKSSLSQDLKSCPVHFNDVEIEVLVQGHTVSPQEEESEDVIYSVVFPRKLRKKRVHKLSYTVLD